MLNINFADKTNFLFGDTGATYPIGSISNDGRTITITDVNKSDLDGYTGLFIASENLNLEGVFAVILCTDNKLFGSNSLEINGLKINGTLHTVDGRNISDASGFGLPLYLEAGNTTKNGTYFITLKYQDQIEKFKIIVNIN